MGSKLYQLLFLCGVVVAQHAYGIMHVPNSCISPIVETEESLTPNLLVNPSEYVQAFGRFTQGINSAFIDRRQALDFLQMALIARQHILLLGPPGNAKSQIGRILKSLIREDEQQKYFELILTPQTTLAETHGPLNAKVAMETGSLERRLEDGLNDADLAFIDEVFDIGENGLRNILGFMNERGVSQGFQRTQGKLHSMVLASNRYLSEVYAMAGDKPRAVLDRVMFTIFVPRSFSKLGAMAAIAQGDFGGDFEDTLSLTQIKALHRLSQKVVIPFEVAMLMEFLHERYHDETEKEEYQRAYAHHEMLQDGEPMLAPPFKATTYSSPRSMSLLASAVRARVVKNWLEKNMQRELVATFEDLEHVLGFYRLNGPGNNHLNDIKSRSVNPLLVSQIETICFERDTSQEIFDALLDAYNTLSPPLASRFLPLFGDTPDKNTFDQALSELFYSLQTSETRYQNENLAITVFYDRLRRVYIDRFGLLAFSALEARFEAGEFLHTVVAPTPQNTVPPEETSPAELSEQVQEFLAGLSGKERFDIDDATAVLARGLTENEASAIVQQKFDFSSLAENNFETPRDYPETYWKFLTQLTLRLGWVPVESLWEEFFICVRRGLSGLGSSYDNDLIGSALQHLGLANHAINQLLESQKTTPENIQKIATLQDEIMHDLLKCMTIDKVKDNRIIRVEFFIGAWIEAARIDKLSKERKITYKHLAAFLKSRKDVVVGATPGRFRQQERQDYVYSANSNDLFRKQVSEPSCVSVSAASTAEEARVLFSLAFLHVVEARFESLSDSEKQMLAPRLNRWIALVLRHSLGDVELLRFRKIMLWLKSQSSTTVATVTGPFEKRFRSKTPQESDFKDVSNLLLPLETYYALKPNTPPPEENIAAAFNVGFKDSIDAEWFFKTAIPVSVAKRTFVGKFRGNLENSPIIDQWVFLVLQQETGTRLQQNPDPRTFLEEHAVAYEALHRHVQNTDDSRKALFDLGQVLVHIDEPTWIKCFDKENPKVGNNNTVVSNVELAINKGGFLVIQLANSKPALFAPIKNAVTQLVLPAGINELVENNTEEGEVRSRLKELLK